jgi:hypothetical protein
MAAEYFIVVMRNKEIVDPPPSRGMTGFCKGPQQIRNFLVLFYKKELLA